jgi:hypothetical protein
VLSPFRFAATIITAFALCGPLSAQEIAPAGSGVSIHKVVVDNGPAHAVRYLVTGGSAQLQALVRRVEWAENELGVIEQLQMLKVDTVVHERQVAAFRTAQLTNPYYPPGFIPTSVGTGVGSYAQGSLQRALTGQLACEATPAAALQMIAFLEQMQTELEAQLKALPPPEKEAARGPIEALRPRVAALSGSDFPPPAVPQSVVPQPVASPQVSLSAPPVPPQPAVTLDPDSVKQVEVAWGQSWWPAEILQVKGNQYLIHYTGFAASWDEWVGKDRIRSRH